MAPLSHLHNEELNWFRLVFKKAVHTTLSHFPLFWLMKDRGTGGKWPVQQFIRVPFRLRQNGDVQTHLLCVVRLCEHLCLGRCNSQSLGFWQQHMSMSCCFGVEEEPSGCDARLTIMCRYCHRAPEGFLAILNFFFYKTNIKLICMGPVRRLSYINSFS